MKSKANIAKASVKITPTAYLPTSCMNERLNQPVAAAAHIDYPSSFRNYCYLKKNSYYVRLPLTDESVNTSKIIPF
jgi:hypothetical protein